MEKILVGILFLVIGLIGILKNKLPKYEDGSGFAIETNYYFGSYLLAIIGAAILVIEIFGDN
ncbi:hypothetical protein SAMN02927937_02056 [Paenimyroides aquimaris]|uniref:Uncharacterized protein n=1 Tax=Paenimyroides marinum TaxID=1159016 RepID=A0A1H6LZX7_9FLAO|nr:hypothetical protein [Paenimyroides aquimaris]SEH90704.1 hypothetical protein SAMN02927937_02056 [Paenimyroides aquimaris]